MPAVMEGTRSLKKAREVAVTVMEDFLLPDVEGVVELLGDGKVGEVPRAAAVVDVLGVAADGDGLVPCGDARVDGVGRAEASRRRA